MNSALLDDWSALRRFLVLGSQRGSYHAAEPALTREGAAAVERCIRRDGPRAVAEIVALSSEGLAPRNDPALFALALAAGIGDEPTRRAALDALPQVARTSEHLFEFITYVEELRGWGRALRRAVGAWYASRPVEALAYQALQDRRRADRNHRDLLRLSHPGEQVSARNPSQPVSDAHRRLFEWIMRGGETDGLPRVVEGFVAAQASAAASDSAALVSAYGLPPEALRTEHMQTGEVWAALVPEMPPAALISSLPAMSAAGALGPDSPATPIVITALREGVRARACEVHPLAVLAARRVYEAGAGERRRERWTVMPALLAALDDAFAATVAAVEPIGGRLLIAIDVSRSMRAGRLSGMPGLSPRDAAAALALTAAATEPNCEIVGFFAGEGGWSLPGSGRFDGRADGITPLRVDGAMTLEQAIAALTDLPFGGSDCALPIRYAEATGRHVDTFIVYSDSDPTVGAVDPARALRDYRAGSGIDARFVAVGMTSKGFTVADPADSMMLDVVGFDAATPRLIASFARGALS